MDENVKKRDRDIINSGKSFLIFTDLDGTLIDENYSFSEAYDLLIKIKDKYPVIFCTGKTKKETEVFLKKAEIEHPFIVEDGTAIYFKKGYFREKKGEYENGYERVILGESIEIIKKFIEDLKKDYKIITFSDLRVEKVSKITGLDSLLAEYAKEREFSEIIVKAEEEAVEKIKEKFNVLLGGRFLHVFSKKADKGKAVKVLKGFYEEFLGRKVITIGVGNSYTDEPMLKEVDIKAIVRNSDGSYADLKLENLYKAENKGPLGWVEVVEKFVLG